MSSSTFIVWVYTYLKNFPVVLILTFQDQGVHICYWINVKNIYYLYLRSDITKCKQRHLPTIYT